MPLLGGIYGLVGRLVGKIVGLGVENSVGNKEGVCDTTGAAVGYWVGASVAGHPMQVTPVTCICRKILVPRFTSSERRDAMKSPPLASRLSVEASSNDFAETVTVTLRDDCKRRRLAKSSI